MLALPWCFPHLSSSGTYFWSCLLYTSYLNAIERTGGSFAGEDAYLEGIPAIAGLGLLELHQPVTFLVGENGSGKSTLLEAVALALGFNPEGGSRNFAFSTRDTHSGLHNYLRLHRGPYRPKAVSYTHLDVYKRQVAAGQSSPPGKTWR